MLIFSKGCSTRLNSLTCFNKLGYNSSQSTKTLLSFNNKYASPYKQDIKAMQNTNQCLHARIDIISHTHSKQGLLATNILLCQKQLRTGIVFQTLL